MPRPDSFTVAGPTLKVLMKDVHEKVASWSRLYTVQKEYEVLVRKARAENGPAAANPSQLEAELKALLVKVDAAFREASEAVHVRRRSADRPSAT